jgi:hypothetical protein
MLIWTWIVSLLSLAVKGALVWPLELAVGGEGGGKSVLVGRAVLLQQLAGAREGR